MNLSFLKADNAEDISIFTKKDTNYKSILKDNVSKFSRNQKKKINKGNIKVLNKFKNKYPERFCCSICCYSDNHTTPSYCFKFKSVIQDSKSFALNCDDIIIE